MKQVLLLAVLLLLIWMVMKELSVFMPGLLGAVTLYILSRSSYFQLIYNKKWKKATAAWLYIFYYLLLLGLPVYLATTLIFPKINAFFDHPAESIESIKLSITQLQQRIGITFISNQSLSNALKKITDYIPGLLNSTANLFTNLVLMLFILYYLLYHGKDLERTLYKIIPLKDNNTSMLASETKKIIKANAIGIPLISFIQGVTACIGYFIFGVGEWGLWGFLTGLFAFFPVVGTMIVWVPLVIYAFASGNTGMGIGVLLYSIVVTGNIDYIARITIMKKLGHVHPVITVLGVIAGLGLFGFIGLIFGPLLVSYILVIFKIYMNEFVDTEPIVQIKSNEQAERTSSSPTL